VLLFIYFLLLVIAITFESIELFLCETSACQRRLWAHAITNAIPHLIVCILTAGVAVGLYQTHGPGA
jgi:hypothetical protein